MKILSLNVWMGRVGGALLRFLKENEFDVICMQEVIRSEDRALHVSRFVATLPVLKEATGLEHEYFSANWGTEIAGGGMAELGNLILSRVPIGERETVFVNGEYRSDLVLAEQPSNIVNLQVVRLENGLNVANHQGYWSKDPMGVERSAEVMGMVAEKLRRMEGPLVFCGDLNLKYEAPAMRCLDWLRNLTEENGVRTTLSGLGFDGEVACDHILVNEAVRVREYRVLPEVVSDHLGVKVEIDL